MVSPATSSCATPRKPVSQVRYELLTLGDELLLGLTANSHLALRHLDIDVRLLRRAAIAIDRNALAIQ